MSVSKDLGGLLIITKKILLLKKDLAHLQHL